MNADEVRRDWANRSAEYSPGYYAYHGPDETSELVRRTLDRLVDPDAAILELGCSSGRHLLHLHEHGYGRLRGVDINGDAFEVMAAEYPGLAAAGRFYHDAIEDAVGRFDDGQFGAVFSVETLQHVHADEAWVFAELARITDDVLLTVERERPGASASAAGETPEVDPGGEDETPGADAWKGDETPGGYPSRGETPVSYENGDFPLYYRPWKRIFTRLGLVEVEARAAGGNTLRAFRHG